MYFTATIELKYSPKMSHKMQMSTIKGNKSQD